MFLKINKKNFALGFILFTLIALILYKEYPYWFGPSYPTSNFIKNYYISHGLADTGSDNIVTAIYLNYRLFDTLFETMLLFVSVIAVFYFSRHKGENE